MNNVGYDHGDIVIHNGTARLSLAAYCDQEMTLIPYRQAYVYCNTFDLGADLRVEVARFRGKTRIDIRQWQDGLRTKRGISLTYSQWCQLGGYTSTLESEMSKLHAGTPCDSLTDLGDSVFVSIQAPYRVYHIRRWYRDEKNELKPGRQGITLREPEWRHLRDIKGQITRAINERPA
jgi:hypothetical protein